MAETGSECIEVGSGAVVGTVMCEVIGDFLAVVGFKRSVDGRDTERIGAEAFEVIEFTRDAGKLAAAVAVGVGKAARIDLVEGGFFPPSGGFGVIERGHFFIQRGSRWICSF